MVEKIIRESVCGNPEEYGADGSCRHPNKNKYCDYEGSVLNLNRSVECLHPQRFSEENCERE